MTYVRIRAVLLALGLMALTAIAAACGSDDTPSATATRPLAAQTTVSRESGTAAAGPTAGASSLRITSSAFDDNGNIPVTYSCDGYSVSPPLTWSGAPEGTQAFALIVDDPDAPVQGGVTHWVTYDIPASVTSLPEAVPEGASIPGGGKQGANVRGALAFTGPCPPAGSSPHHYQFRLYALSAPTGLPPGKSRADALAAIASLTLAEAEIVGLFAH
jgi:Raf kinase inhibitor-like YbhB/YbcL family protein